MLVDRMAVGRETMTSENDKVEERPDLVSHYRPVAIRSVVAAHAMIPKIKQQPDADPPDTSTQFSLPPGFHSPPDD
jgi:hypothetical protein